MADYTLGKTEILAIYDGTDSYDPLVCLTQSSISESVDEITAPRTKCDTNNALTSAPGDYSYEISFEGVYAFTEADKLSWAEIKTKLRALETFTWQLTTTFPNETPIVEYGTGWFNNLDKTAETSEYITFTGGIRGSGGIEDTDPNA